MLFSVMWIGKRFNADCYVIKQGDRSCRHVLIQCLQKTCHVSRATMGISFDILSRSGIRTQLFNPY